MVETGTKPTNNTPQSVPAVTAYQKADGTQEVVNWPTPDAPLSQENIYKKYYQLLVPEYNALLAERDKLKEERDLLQAAANAYHEDNAQLVESNRKKDAKIEDVEAGLKDLKALLDKQIY